MRRFHRNHYGNPRFVQKMRSYVRYAANMAEDLQMRLECMEEENETPDYETASKKQKRNYAFAFGNGIDDDYRFTYTA